ncbi:uncharacterized protein [Pseudorasbora parva]|uniref:uncharacterized protein n=1 Tax=Pseudorasbora parva TaxID=51549 RepID=UPI00351E3C8A
MACNTGVQSDHYRELAYAVRLAAKFSVPQLEKVTSQSVIDNFFWNLTERNLEVIQAALSYPFSRQQIHQMLTAIAASATTTAAGLMSNLSGVVGMDTSAVVNPNRPSTSASTEDLQQDPSEEGPVILKTERLPFVYPLETLFGITVDVLLSSGECDFSDSLGEDGWPSSEFAGIVVEEVWHQVNVVMHNNILKINAASSPCFVYFCPDDSCSNIGELLISRVIRKLSVLHCHITRRAAMTAIGMVLAAIEAKLPCALRPSRTNEATSNVIDYIVEELIRAWDPTAASRTWRSGPVPVLRLTFETHEGGLSLVLLESDQPSNSDGAKTITLFDSLMTALYMSKCSGHVSGQDISYAASGRLQRLTDLMNCVQRCEMPLTERDSEEVRTTAKDFLHYFVEELVQRLLVSSRFPQPAKLPENTPVMPFTMKEEDFDLTVLDHLTELVVSQVFDSLAKKFPPAEQLTPIEMNSQAVSVQEDLPKLTFRNRLKMMKSNILKKMKNPFRSKKDRKSKGDTEERAAQEPKKKSSFLGRRISFSLKIKFRGWF